MISDTGCCGFGLQEDNVTFLGLMTLSFPIIILCILLAIVFSVLGVVNRRIKRIAQQIVLILKANSNLIQTAALYPKLRCALAGKIFSFSPKISGFMYRYFNMGLLSLFWIIIVFCVYSVAFILTRI